MSVDAALREQVFTRTRKPRGQKGYAGQGRIADRVTASSRWPTYRERATARTKTPRRGGWGHTIELSYSEMRYAAGIKAATDRNRTPLNYFASIHCPDGLTLQESKRFLELYIARLGQALKRNGYPHFGITTFERKRDDQSIHAHHQFHVPKGAFHIVDRFADGIVVDIKKSHHNSLRYMLKQHVQMNTDFEKTRPDIFRPRQPGDYIPGKRLSVTKAAKALVPDAENPKRKVTPWNGHRKAPIEAAA